MADSQEEKKANLYAKLILSIFQNHYKNGVARFEFERDEIESTANRLQVKLPKNFGDVIYSIRYRQDLPQEIQATQPAGKEWAIVGAGKGKYAFRLGPPNLIVPTEGKTTVKILDSTPGIVAAYSVTDEQALLSRIRYNRLIDMFLGIVAYSLQNHLRTTVATVGQIEIDELYVGLDKKGCRYIIPVQAKGGSDRLSRVQTEQDIAYCEIKFPNVTCRAISTQFMADGRIALFELVRQEGEVRVADERHYELVPLNEVDGGE